MNGGAIIGINHMATGTTTVAVIACLFVGAREIKCRIKEAGFGKAHENRVGTIFRTQTTIT